ncbi:flagellar biosynthetic protein FliR [Ruegeria pomeroyi]|nr:flagellar biosynthetic protein FliR [Ruegeria pomeroyi]
MIALPPELLALISGELWQVFAVFLRVSALVSVLPALGEQSIPMRVRLGVATAFAVIVAPAAPAAPEVTNVLQFTALAGTEVLAGLVMGLGIRLFAIALQVAGMIAAQATSLSQLLGNAVAEPTPAMGHLLMMGGLALAVMSGLHVRVAEFLIHSYSIFPIGELPHPGDLSQWGVAQVGRMFALAFGLAAPFVIASLIYNLTLGAINRAMPQLMVAFVGAPVITLGGMALLLVGTPLLLSVWLDALWSFFQDPIGARP